VSPAVASLVALVVAIVLSMTSRINVGVLAIAFAWLIGGYAGLRPDAVMAGFPVSLFLTLAGVTLLFSVAEANGTLELLARRAVRLARGNARLIPIIFFLIACAVSSAGPGAICSVALVAPLAMATAKRACITPLLTALMVTHGACAGNLSPISSVGVIANSKMGEAGLVGHEGKVWLANFVAHAVVAVAAYFVFGGFRLGGRAIDSVGPVAPAVAAPPFDRPQRLTIAILAVWILGVAVFKLTLGLSAFAAAAILVLSRATDEGTAIRKMPWGVIVMVSGVSVLVALLEETGGMELFTAMLARLATPESVNGVIALVTGVISTYSSTSGVVLPAFLPTIPGLVRQLGGGDPLAIALSINVGSALVDVAPLSTLGALCVAAVTGHAASRLLFRQLLAWGLSMSVVGAVMCQLFAGWLASA
jgi:Na+/H+ antiporter NhaD/arsenite permease-like protein